MRPGLSILEEQLLVSSVLNIRPASPMVMWRMIQKRLSSLVGRHLGIKQMQKHLRILLYFYQKRGRIYRFKSGANPVQLERLNAELGKLLSGSVSTIVEMLLATPADPDEVNSGNNSNPTPSTTNGPFGLETAPTSGSVDGGNNILDDSTENASSSITSSRPGATSSELNDNAVVPVRKDVSRYVPHNGSKASGSYNRYDSPQSALLMGLGLSVSIALDLLKENSKGSKSELPDIPDQQVKAGCRSRTRTATQTAPVSYPFAKQSKNDNIENFKPPKSGATPLKKTSFWMAKQAEDSATAFAEANIIESETEWFDDPKYDSNDKENCAYDASLVEADSTARNPPSTTTLGIYKKAKNNVTKAAACPDPVGNSYKTILNSQNAEKSRKTGKLAVTVPASPAVLETGVWTNTITTTLAPSTLSMNPQCIFSTASNVRRNTAMSDYYSDLLSMVVNYPKPTSELDTKSTLNNTAVTEYAVTSGVLDASIRTNTMITTSANSMCMGNYILSTVVPEEDVPNFQRMVEVDVYADCSEDEIYALI